MLAMTRSGWVARSSSVLAVQLSCRMWGFLAARSGRASRQYFVQAQRRSRRLRAERVTVMEGWREATRMRLEYRILERTSCQGDVPPSPGEKCAKSNNERL